MNKKAFALSVFLTLIAVAVIASSFFIFYMWYGFSENRINFKIDDKAADFKESQVLISLLNTYYKDKTIADLIVTNDPNLQLAVDTTLRSIYGPNIRYKLIYDVNVIAQTPVLPKLPISQTVYIPVLGPPQPTRIILEFGI